MKQDALYSISILEKALEYLEESYIKFKDPKIIFIAPYKLEKKEENPIKKRIMSGYKSLAYCYMLIGDVNKAEYCYSRFLSLDFLGNSSDSFKREKEYGCESSDKTNINNRLDKFRYISNTLSGIGYRIFLPNIYGYCYYFEGSHKEYGKALMLHGEYEKAISLSKIFPTDDSLNYFLGLAHYLVHNEIVSEHEGFIKSLRANLDGGLYEKEFKFLDLAFQVENENKEESLKIFFDLQDEKDIWFYNSGLINKLLKVLLKNGTKDDQTHLINLIIRFGKHLEDTIDVLYKAGKINHIENIVLELKKKRELRPVHRYVRLQFEDGKEEKALKLFNEVESYFDGNSYADICEWIETLCVMNQQKRAAAFSNPKKIEEQEKFRIITEVMLQKGETLEAKKYFNRALNNISIEKRYQNYFHYEDLASLYEKQGCFSLAARVLEIAFLNWHHQYEEEWGKIVYCRLLKVCLKMKNLYPIIKELDLSVVHQYQIISLITDTCLKKEPNDNNTDKLLSILEESGFLHSAEEYGKLAFIYYRSGNLKKSSELITKANRIALSSGKESKVQEICDLALWLYEIEKTGRE